MNSEKTSRLCNLWWLSLTFIVVIVDQASKYFVTKYLVLFRPVLLLPDLNFTLAHNEGAAFGFLKYMGGWQRYLFSVVAIITSAIIVFWLYRLPRRDHWTAAALAFILGGALGNLLDRVRFGYVVDFVDVYVRNWHFATFNVADIAINIGVIILIVTYLTSKNK